MCYFQVGSYIQEQHLMMLPGSCPNHLDSDIYLGSGFGSVFGSGATWFINSKLNWAFPVCAHLCSYLFECRVLRCGFWNSSASFQRGLNSLLNRMVKFAAVCIDNPDRNFDFVDNRRQMRKNYFLASLTQVEGKDGHSLCIQ